MQIKLFSQALSYLYAKIPGKDTIFPADWGIARTRDLLSLIGNPQNQIKVVHIAGTSGKGSTTVLIANLLQRSGFKVGHTLSPHLYDIRERIQIDQKLISRSAFVKLLNQLIPAIEKTTKAMGSSPSYFEITTCMMYLYFYQQKVDYALIETGLGGKYDATNVVNNPNKICVLTQIGLDHTHILGKTLSEISSQKAGIIGKSNLVMTFKQDPKVNQVFANQAQLQNAKLISLDLAQTIKPLAFTAKTTKFDFDYQTHHLPGLKSSLVGSYQLSNLALALATYCEIMQRENKTVLKSQVRKGLKLKFAGRLEIRKIKNRTVIIDGAHNPQKMQGLIDSLKTIFPNQKFSFIIAFKYNKDIQNMLQIMLPLAEQFIITSFDVAGGYESYSADPMQVQNQLHKLGYKKTKVIYQAKQALKYAVDHAKSPIVVTGSLYLISELFSSVK